MSVSTTLVKYHVMLKGLTASHKLLKGSKGYNNDFNIGYDMFHDFSSDLNVWKISGMKQSELESKHWKALAEHCAFNHEKINQKFTQLLAYRHEAMEKLMSDDSLKGEK